MSTLGPFAKRLLVGVLSWPLVACQTGPARLGDGFMQPSLRGELSADHARSAAAYEAAGALREARREWQLIDALGDRTQEARHEIARLDAEIDRRFRQHLGSAQRAMNTGRLPKARSELLRALALRPDDPAAIQMIRLNQARLDYARLAALPKAQKGEVSEADAYSQAREEAAGSAHSDGGGSRPSARAGKPTDHGRQPVVEERIEAGVEYLSRKQYGLALAAFSEANDAARSEVPGLQAYIAESRRGLVNSHYAAGVKAFREGRYDDAVTAFERVLKYEPEHHKARFYLSSAQSLRER